MLDALKKKLFKPAEEAKTEDTTETMEIANSALTVTVDATDVQAEIDKLKVEFESFKAEANALTAELEKQLADAAEKASAELAAKEQVIANLIAEKESMVAEAATKKIAARKEKVVAAIGTEKADEFMAATGNLDDAAFEAVVSTLVGSVDAEASSAMFKEVGVTAEADASVLEEKPTHFNTFIKK